MLAMSESTGFIVKVVILLALAPYWIPVLKAIYDDFEAALWKEGGLFGRPPTGDEYAELQQKYRRWKSPLVSTPRARRDRGRGARRA